MSTLDNPIIENNNPSSPWSTAIRYGGIMGLISIIIALVIYLMVGTDEVSSSAWIIMAVLSLASIVVSIVLQSMSAKAYRSSIGGFISFGKAFQAAFFTALIGMAISMVWQIFSETVLISDMEAYTENISRMFMEPFGMDPNQIDETLDAQRPLYKGLGRNLLNSILGGGIFSLIIALIVGAVVRKEQPMQM